MPTFRHTAAFLIALLIGILATALLLPATAPRWVWAQAGSAAESTANAYVLQGDLTLTDVTGTSVGTLSVAGNLQPSADASTADELTLPGPDGNAWLALPGAEVRYDDEHGSGSGSFFNSQQEAPAGMHYAIVTLTVSNRTRQPLAGRSQTSFFGSDAEPWLFGIDNTGGLAAPTGNPPGLPCEDLNPGAVGSCELAFLLPDDRTLAALQILWPTSFTLAIPE